MLAEKRRAKRGFLVAERLGGWRDGALPPRKHDALSVCASFGAATKGHAIFAQTPRTSLCEGLACERQRLDGMERSLAAPETAGSSGLMTGQSDMAQVSCKEMGRISDAFDDRDGDKRPYRQKCHKRWLEVEPTCERGLSDNSLTWCFINATECVSRAVSLDNLAGVSLSSKASLNMAFRAQMGCRRVPIAQSVNVAAASCTQR